MNVEIQIEPHIGKRAWGYFAFIVMLHPLLFGCGSHISISGKEVVGSWRQKTYDATGVTNDQVTTYRSDGSFSISGQLSKDGMVVAYSASGKWFLMEFEG